jgi:hypothetical protein
MTAFARIRRLSLFRFIAGRKDPRYKLATQIYPKAKECWDLETRVESVEKRVQYHPCAHHNVGRNFGFRWLSSVLACVIVKSDDIAEAIQVILRNGCGDRSKWTNATEESYTSSVYSSYDGHVDEWVYAYTTYSEPTLNKQLGVDGVRTLLAKHAPTIELTVSNPISEQAFLDSVRRRPFF